MKKPLVLPDLFAITAVGGRIIISELKRPLASNTIIDYAEVGKPLVEFTITSDSRAEAIIRCVLRAALQRAYVDGAQDTLELSLAAGEKEPS